MEGFGNMLAVEPELMQIPAFIAKRSPHFKEDTDG